MVKKPNKLLIVDALPPSHAKPTDNASLNVWCADAVYFNACFARPYQE